MSNERKPRTTQVREKTSSRRSDSYIPPSKLPTPDPRDGMTFRWIRTATLGNADISNVSKRFREGWQPVKAEEFPELEIMSDLDSRWKDGIEVQGLLLCQIPTEQVEKRNAYYAQQAANQMTAVDQGFMRENDPRMPLLDPERKSRTEFGSG